MKYRGGYWFFNGRTYATLRAALLAAWPKEGGMTSKHISEKKGISHHG